MPRINPRLDPHELTDLMADPEHWDLLDQVPRHPAAWPDLATWAKLALNDPSAAGAPPEPPGGTPRKRKTPRHPADPMGGKGTRSGRIG